MDYDQSFGTQSHSNESLENGAAAAAEESLPFAMLEAIDNRRAIAVSNVVWLINSHALLRSGIRAQLESKGFEVAVEATEIEEISRNRSASPAPNLIIVDLKQGFDVIAKLKAAQPQARTVVLAEPSELSLLPGVFEAGADGFLLTSISPNALIDSLKLVTTGEKVFPSMLTQLFGTMRPDQSGSIEIVRVGGVVLTKRELDVIRRVADGHSNKMIARDMKITEATVKVHVKNVLHKLGVVNRTQIAIWAIQNGLTARTMGHTATGG